MPPKKPATAAVVAAAPVLDPEAEAERRLLAEQCNAMKRQRTFEDGQLAQFYEEKVHHRPGMRDYADHRALTGLPDALRTAGAHCHRTCV